MLPVAGPLVGAGAGGDARRTTLKTATPLRASKSCDHHSRAARGSVDRLRAPPHLKYTVVSFSFSFTQFLFCSGYVVVSLASDALFCGQFCVRRLLPLPSLSVPLLVLFNKIWFQISPWRR